VNPEGAATEARGTAALKKFEEAVRDLSHLGTLLQALPKIVQQLMEANPAATELRHLQEHKFLEWPLIQDGFYTGLTDKTLLLRIVDGFRLYASQIIYESSKMNAQPAAEAADLRQVSRIVEKRLSQGLPALTTYVSDVLRRPFFIQGDAYINALSAIAVRNAEIYNGGDIDDEFVRQLGREDVKVGGKFRVETPNVLDWLDALGNVAAIIDAEFVDRFGLPTVGLYPENVVN
jgi:hypothetical protein